MFEKCFVFEHQPGGVEWRVLEVACSELAKLAELVAGKIEVRGGRVGGWGCLMLGGKALSFLFFMLAVPHEMHAGVHAIGRGELR